MLRHSQSDTRNPDVVDWTDRFRGEDNSAFFSAAIDELSEQDGLGLIGLVGSCDLPGVALRRAQSILRWDRRPSQWSHAFLLVGGGELREVTLHSRAGHFPEPERQRDHAGHARPLRLAARGRQRRAARGADGGRRGAPRRRARDAAPQPRAPALRPLRDARHLAVLPVDARHAEPARDRRAQPSSALVEYCFEEIQLDLTPGANDRNSAPEHLWNSARWWARSSASSTGRSAAAT